MTTAFPILPFCRTTGSGQGTFTLLQTSTVSSNQAVINGIDGTYNSYFIEYYDVTFNNSIIAASPSWVAYASTDNGVTPQNFTNAYFYYGWQNRGSITIVTPSLYTVGGIPGDTFIPMGPEGGNYCSGRMHIIGAFDAIDTRYYIENASLEWAIISPPFGIGPTGKMYTVRVPGHFDSNASVNSFIFTGYGATMLSGTFKLYGY